MLTAPLPVLRRPDGTVQLGLEPPAGLLLGRLPPAAEAVIDVLNEPCTAADLERLAGPASGRWLPRLLESLQRAGLLRRPSRTSAGVAVIGSGRLALLVTRLLVQTVTDPIRAVLPGAPASPAALERLRRRYPDRIRFSDHLAREHRSEPGLALVCARSPEADRSLLRHLDDRPHLVVAASGLGVSVGPLVVPGRTACLRCEDLHRTGHDPAWPELLLQLSRPRSTDPTPADLHWAAGSAVQQAASWLAGGRPDALGVTLVLDAEHALRARPLRAHPGCGCGAAG